MAHLSHNDIAQAIFEQTKNLRGGELEGALKNAVAFLAKKNLLSKSKDILARLEELWAKEKGILPVEVWSKEKLSAHAKGELNHFLAKRYKEKDFVYKEHLDESVMGGYKLRIRDEMIDMTLRTRIKNLQKYLITNHE